MIKHFQQEQAISKNENKVRQFDRWINNSNCYFIFIHQGQYLLNSKQQMGNCRSSPSPTDQQQLPTQNVGRSRFNPFFQPNAQNNQQQQILAQYNFHSNYDDKFLGRCSILEHKQTKNFFLSKEIDIGSDAQYDRKLNQFLELQQKLNFENIIQIKHIIEKESDGFFTKSKKIIVIVDYPLTNMQKQLNSRLVNNLEFTREQIINVLISCIKGYALIERNKQQGNLSIFRNDKIRLKNIFFGIKNRDSLIKVAESSLLNQKNNMQCIYDNAFDVPQNRDIYLAPEQFQAYLNGQKGNTFEKAGVFSFGMSVLDLCLMTSSRQAYQYDDKVMDFNEIRNRISIAGKKYGAIVERFLVDMLEIDDRKRLSFNQLQTKIPSLLVSRNAEQGSRMNLSIVRPNSVHLRNNPRAIRQSTNRSRDSGRSRSRSGSINRGNISSNYSSMSIASRYNSKMGKRMRGEKQDSEQLDRVHEIYDREAGRQYIGEKKGNVKHGQGRYQFQKGGAYYQGQWRNNKMQGKGETYFREGQLQYSGEWKADEYHGWGIVFSNPELNSRWVSYEGEFKNGVKEGRGQMKFKNGFIYDGEFRGDKIHGKGKIMKDGKVVKDSFWELVNPQIFIQESRVMI